MSNIQIILLVIIALIIGTIFRKYQLKTLVTQEFFLWTTFWLLGAVLVAFPGITGKVAQAVGIGRGVDLIIYLSLIALFFATFIILIKLARIEHDITKIVRRLAFDDKKKENTP